MVQRADHFLIFTDLSVQRPEHQHMQLFSCCFDDKHLFLITICRDFAMDNTSISDNLFTSRLSLKSDRGFNSDRDLDI